MSRNTPNSGYYARSNHAHLSKNQVSRKNISSAQGKLILRDLNNPDFDGRYQPSYMNGRVSRSHGIFIASAHRVFKKRNADGSWCVVARWSAAPDVWTVYYGETDPDTWTSGYPTMLDGNTVEVIKVASEHKSRYDAPASGGRVSYKQR